MNDSLRALAVQADEEYDLAVRIARKHWGPNTPPEVIQAAAATVLIHIKDLRKNGAAASVGQTGGRVSGQAGHPPARAHAVPNCPKCGGEMWDNRGRKKNPKGPDFACKDKGCLDANGYTTGLWERDLAKLQAATAVRDGLDSYAQMPTALQREEPPLPF